jgi:hypothetical protein
VEAIEDMLERTHTDTAPWTLVNGDKKKPARIAVLQAVYDRLRPVIRPEPPEASEEVMGLARAAFG